MRQMLRSLRTLTHKMGLASSSSKPSSVLPTSRFHWILPGELALGGLPASGDRAIFDQANISIVFSLCAQSEGDLPETITQNFRCVRVILPDSRYVATLQVEQLAQVVNSIHQFIQRQQPVYVHCLAGIERSPTVCIAYLCQYHNMKLWEAFNYVKEICPRAMPTDAQLKTVQRYLVSF